jgi:hypothetical protein
MISIPDEVNGFLTTICELTVQKLRVLQSFTTHGSPQPVTVIAFILHLNSIITVATKVIYL